MILERANTERARDENLLKKICFATMLGHTYTVMLNRMFFFSNSAIEILISGSEKFNLTDEF